MFATILSTAFMLVLGMAVLMTIDEVILEIKNGGKK